MFENLTKTQQTLAAGLILGGIFAVGIFMGFIVWHFVSMFGVPLAQQETDSGPSIISTALLMGIMLFAGMLSGCFVALLTFVPRKIIGLLLVGCMSYLFFEFLIHKGPFPLPLGIVMLSPFIVGYLLLLGYLQWRRTFISAFLAFFLGIGWVYFPYGITESSYYDAVHSTNHYAQEHGLVGYNIAINESDSFLKTEIHQPNGSVLTCTSQNLNWDDIQCVK